MFFLRQWKPTEESKIKTKCYTTLMQTFSKFKPNCRGNIFLDLQIGLMECLYNKHPHRNLMRTAKFTLSAATSR